MTLRKRVYLATPITKGDHTANAKRADEAMFSLLSAGFAVLNPALTMWAGAAEKVDNTFLAPFPSPTAHGQFRLIHHADWVANCLPWVACADAVYRVPGESTGADQETAFARGLNIPVFEVLEDLFRHFAPPPAPGKEVSAHPLAWENH